MFLNIYKKINSVFGNGVKSIIGITFIVAAVIIDVAVGYAYNYNALLAMIACFGVLSLINALFSKIYKIPFSYILFMLVNYVGLFLYLFIVSEYDAIGTLFMVLFSLLVFIALWIFEICIINRAGLARRILGGLLVNVAVTISLIITVIGIVSISDCNNMIN